MFKQFLFLSIGLFCFSACSHNAKVLIDNPLSEELTVKIGEKSFTISPEKSEYAELATGELSYQANAKDQNFSGTAKIEGDGLLNLTGAEYIVWKDIYVDRKKYPKSMPTGALKEDTLTMDGKKYFGEFVHFEKNKTFIPMTWDYDVATAFPDTMALVGKDYMTQKKVYRKKDFIADYEGLNGMDEETLRMLDSMINAMKVDSLALEKKK